MKRTHLLPSLLSCACLLAAVPGASLRAEDADRFRPYLRFHSGDISPLWGVDDLWSFGLGANFNRYLGAELTLDYFERDFDYAGIGTLGEVSSWNILPHLRVRYPLFKDRLVPYVLVGAGPSFLQFNDQKKDAFGTDVEIEGTTFAVAAGGGLEYFLADNVTFGIEGKYIWINPIDGTVGGQTTEVDVSSAMFTFGLRIYFDENHPRPLLTADGPAPTRFYFGWRVGGFALTDNRWIPGVTVSPDNASKANLSQTGGLALGLDFSRHLGVELTFDSLEPNVHMDGVGTIGEYGMAEIIPHLRLRYPLGKGRWVPYFMAGAGITYGEFNDAKEPIGTMKFDAKGIAPALSVGGGIEYFLVRNFSLNFDARWLYTWDHEIEVNETYTEKGDLSFLQLNLGFRVYLAESKSGSEKP